MNSERSVWVVGDIHGMLDPLTVLLNTIRCVEYSRHRRTTLVFLGDYIDHGPCTKEVIDALTALRDEFEVVLLAGNHEDMMLQFLDPQPGMEEYAKLWLHGNGGQATLCSLLKSPHILKRLWMRSSTTRPLANTDIALHPRYHDFLESLVYAHSEQLELDGSPDHPLNLAFTHAPLHRGTDLAPSPDGDEHIDIPLSRQLSARTREEFLQLCCEYRTWIEHYHIWNRALPRTKYGDFMLIHGHTPTSILHDQEGTRLGTYKPESARPFVIFPEGQQVNVHTEEGNLCFDAPLTDVVGINIDTGCVYGDALTALNFSTHRLRTDARIGVIQVHPGWAQRDYGACRRFHLQFSGR